jgi:hypothetical protein
VCRAVLERAAPKGRAFAVPATAIVDVEIRKSLRDIFETFISLSQHSLIQQTLVMVLAKCALSLETARRLKKQWGGNETNHRLEPVINFVPLFAKG